MWRFPDSHVLWGNRGFVLLSWERYDEALENCAEAFRIKPDYSFALANMALTYECLHEFRRAAEMFHRVVELTPEHAIAWNSLGLCLGQLGDDERAKQSYVKALAVDPEYIPLFNLAALLCSQRKYAAMASSMMVTSAASQLRPASRNSWHAWLPAIGSCRS
jgi:tetratricopeptide (TPR) repeat protein